MAIQIFAVCKIAAWVIRSSRPTTTLMTQGLAMKCFSSCSASSGGRMEFSGDSPRIHVDLGEKLAGGNASPAAPTKIADRKRNTAYTARSGDVPARRKKKPRVED